MWEFEQRSVTFERDLELSPHSDADCMVIDKLTITDGGTTKAPKPLNNVAQHSEEHQNTAAVTEATMKDR